MHLLDLNFFLQKIKKKIKKLKIKVHNENFIEFLGISCANREKVATVRDNICSCQIIKIAFFISFASFGLI